MGNQSNNSQQYHCQEMKIRNLLNQNSDRIDLNRTCSTLIENNIPACLPNIWNPCYIGMKRLLHFWTIEIHVRMPFGTRIICSRHPWLFVL